MFLGVVAFCLKRTSFGKPRAVSDPLLSQVSSVGENVLVGRNRLRETECRQREKRWRKFRFCDQ